MGRIPGAITRPFNRILRRAPQASRYPITLYPNLQPALGRVLFSYLEYPLLWSEEDSRFDGHTNNWESREIARIFRDLGYIVDAINWTDQEFTPSLSYDVFFDIFTNLQRIAPFLDRSTIKILHCTGSDPHYQNGAEMRRVEALERRRGVLYSPKRQVPYPELARKSIRIADACSQLGNDHTVGTYPPELRGKIWPVTVSASRLLGIKSRDEFVPPRKEFLWFFGEGAVHKGLDLVLEVFARNPDLTLNVIGNLPAERDFLQIYERELTQLENIKQHDYVNPNSESFKRIMRDIFCFVAPTCSEGISTAVATCLQIGLYPIVSRDTGVSLPEGCGTYIEDCSIGEIESAVWNAYCKSAQELVEQISGVQAYAAQKYSRTRFRKEMTDFISKALQTCWGRDRGLEGHHEKILYR